MSLIVRIAFPLLLFWLSIGIVYAATVQPMRFELSPAGQNSRAKLKIFNDGARPITVEASPWISKVSPEGEETVSPADDDIIVFPPTAIVEPGKTQFFQVQYVGEPELSVSRFYRVRIEQLPVKLDRSEDGLSLAFRFNTMLNVVPPQSIASPKVSSITPADNGDSYTIEFINTGSRFVRLHETSWVVTTRGETTELSNARVRDLVPDVLVLPESSRIITVTPSSDLELNNASIFIKLDQ